MHLLAHFKDGYLESGAGIKIYAKQMWLHFRARYSYN